MFWLSGIPEQPSVDVRSAIACDERPAPPDNPNLTSPVAAAPSQVSPDVNGKEAGGAALMSDRSLLTAPEAFTVSL